MPPRVLGQGTDERRAHVVPRALPRTRRAGHSLSNSPPGVSISALRLLDRLDVENDRHLVADNRTASFQRQVEVDAEVFAVQHD
jgi:hypothetical protein